MPGQAAPAAMPIYAQSGNSAPNSYGYGATTTVMKAQDSPQGSYMGIFTPRNVFIIAGVILLLLICIVPFWNAMELLGDANYVFWQGRATPGWMIGICIGTIVLYVVTVFVFFGYTRPRAQTEQTIMMIANVFITLLGLALMIVSVPLSRQAVTTYNNLMHKCDFSAQTHRLYEYSRVLHNIRATPECTRKYTVAACTGYKAAEPYTSFLRVMETQFRCSGFCYAYPVEVQSMPLPMAGVMNVTNETSMPLANTSLMNTSLITRRRMRHVDHMMPLPTDSVSLLATERAYAGGDGYAYYPPTLFSDANYQASCEGMAARDMRNFAGDIAFQTFYQGIYLTMIAIATGFLKLLGFCVNWRRDDDMKVSRYGV